MRMLTRYILAELSKVFLVSLIVVTGLMMIVSVVREAIGHGLPPAQVVQLIPYSLPGSCLRPAAECEDPQVSRLS